MISSILYTCCLLCPLYLIYKPPHTLVKYLRRRWPDVLFHHPTTHKVIALTIDDAPSTHTPAIQELLKSHSATATFFIIGSQVPGHESDLANLIRDGNELANHAMYDEPSRALSDATLAEQIATVEVMIQNAYREAGQDGPENWFFRPGSGFFSSRMRALVKGLGYRLALGDVYPHDPQVPFANLNARHILSMIRPGSIIVCHDRREWTVPMLGVVLPELRRRGYRVVMLSKLIKEG
jgi:peptidoglycan/xylan/chitin deacetylase (PgdA/CDA1 family)